MSYLEYGYDSAQIGHTAAYLLPPIFELMAAYPPPARVLDVGCGNGSMTARYVQRGYRAVGIDLSATGLEIARKAHPGIRFEPLAADAAVLANLGEEPFDLVISTEVVEHLYDPRAYAAGCFAACRPGGRFICSTPYHGYLKNFLIGLSGKWDQHLSPLWDSGHIKMWSRRTLTQLLTEVGFTNVQFRGAGRLPYLWMSMVVSGDRPK
jgi:2-polyprenyl-6-hydroxyphenyl methylase/3-demethylubiquinone-9 3-methyltransferase